MLMRLLQYRKDYAYTIPASKMSEATTRSSSRLLLTPNYTGHSHAEDNRYGYKILP